MDTVSTLYIRGEYNFHRLLQFHTNRRNELPDVTQRTNASITLEMNKLKSNLLYAAVEFLPRDAAMLAQSWES